MRWRPLLPVLAGAVGGALLLAAAYRFGLLTPNLNSSPARDIVAVAAMSDRAAARHRGNGFAELHDIAALQALPTEFDRAEALYALAGRADSGKLQALAWEALRIADVTWRERALSIVFFRLAERDPRTALVLAGQAPFTGMRTLEARVLRTWARYDLDAVLLEVAGLDDDAKRRDAVETIYRALDTPYGGDAQRVEAATGIAPGGSARARYLMQLAADDVDAALAHVLGLQDAADRIQQARNLGTLLARETGRDAEAFAAGIDDVEVRQNFLAAVYRELAKTEPDYAFEQRFASRDPGELSDSERDYLERLAGRDLERALRLASESNDPLARRSASAAIAEVYARQRPREALAWAAGIGDADGILGAVIKTAAATEAELALQTALAHDDAKQRGRLALAAIDGATDADSAKLAILLTEIGDQATQFMASRSLAKKWLDTDPVAAVDWLLGTDQRLQQVVFQDRRALDKVDLDSAQAIVGRLPADMRRQWNNAIVRRLIDERTAGEAMNYLSQFAGQPGHVAEMSMLVTTVAASDRTLAMQWLERIPDRAMRDATLANVVGNAARDDPEWAASRLATIDDPDLRAAATADVLNRWRRDDADAARAYLDRLPRGATRDSVVLGLAMDSHQDRAEQTRLIESIDDTSLRSQALLFRDLVQSRGDPEEMIRQLDAIEMPEIFRQQMKAEILRGAARGY